LWRSSDAGFSRRGGEKFLGEGVLSFASFYSWLVIYLKGIHECSAFLCTSKENEEIAIIISNPDARYARLGAG